MYFGRKFSQAKWNINSQNNQDANFDENEIPADAISADLRTQSNTLSFWKCTEINENKDVASPAINDVFLALVSNFQRFDKIAVVFVEGQLFKDDKQKISQTKGNTPVASLEALHFDIMHLDYIRLGQVAERILEAKDKKQIKSLTKKKVKNLLVEAVKSKHLNIKDIHENLRKEIEEAIEV